MESMLTPTKRAKSKAYDNIQKIQIFKHENIEFMTRCYKETISYSITTCIIRAAHCALILIKKTKTKTSAGLLYTEMETLR